MLTEMLQGFGSDGDFNQAKKLLMSLVVVDLGGRSIAIQAAKNFRALRALRITVRKTIDTVIATRCIESGYTLLYSDRDLTSSLHISVFAPRCKEPNQKWKRNSGTRARDASAQCPTS